MDQRSILIMFSSSKLLSKTQKLKAKLMLLQKYCVHEVTQAHILSGAHRVPHKATGQKFKLRIWIWGMLCVIWSVHWMLFMFSSHTCYCATVRYFSFYSELFIFIFSFLPFVLYKARDIDRQLITVLCKVILLSNELFVQLRRGFAFQSNLPDFSKMFFMWLISSAWSGKD